MSKRGAMMAAARQQSSGAAPSLTVAALGAQVYFDMADNTASGMTMGTGSNIATFIDKSGNSRNITQADSAKQGVWDATAGGLGLITTTAIGTLPSLTFTSYVCVVQYKDGIDPTFDDYAALFTTSGGSLRSIGTPTAAFLHGASIGNTASVNGYATSATVLPLAKSIVRVSFASMTQPINPLWSLASTTRGFHGFAWAVVVPPANSDSTYHEKLEGILAHKYGIQSKLPSSHIYKSAPPTV